MSTHLLLLYKGYELHPLVFARTFSRFDGHSRYAEGYDIAVRICRPGAIATSAASRIFRLDKPHAYSDFGMARRAARQQERTSSTERWVELRSSTCSSVNRSGRPRRREKLNARILPHRYRHHAK